MGAFILANAHCFKNVCLTKAVFIIEHISKCTKHTFVNCPHIARVTNVGPGSCFGFQDALSFLSIGPLKHGHPCYMSFVNKSIILFLSWNRMFARPSVVAVRKSKVGMLVTPSVHPSDQLVDNWEPIYLP